MSKTVLECIHAPADEGSDVLSKLETHEEPTAAQPEETVKAQPVPERLSSRMPELHTQHRETRLSSRAVQPLR